MPNVPLENLLGKTCNSVYKLVIAASRRALEIAEGQPKLVEVNSSTKPATVALFEIAEAKVQCKIVKEKG